MNQARALCTDNDISLASIGIGITNIVLNPTGFIAISTGPLFISWAISLLVIDWVVSALIIVALARKKSGLHRSDKLVMRMIMYVSFTPRPGRFARSRAWVGMLIDTA